jgi:glycosyltransferase involved in cell wall biosynthesis
MKKNYFFKDVTLLVTHYNRSQSLEQLLNSFVQLDCRFEDIVVSDDGSRPEHIDYL